LSAFSFKKTDRILKRADFENLWKSGKKIYEGFFVVHYTKTGLGKSRLGVTVSKKVGCAVVRNRIKRLTREFFRLNRSRVNGAYDMNVIARAGINELSNEKIFQALERSLLRISPEDFQGLLK
jgi:ribonuclease P protein component